MLCTCWGSSTVPAGHACTTLPPTPSVSVICAPQVEKDLKTQGDGVTCWRPPSSQAAGVSASRPGREAVAALGLVLFSMHSVHCWPCNHWRVLGLCCQEFNSETRATPSAFAREAPMAPVGRRCGPRGYFGRVIGESGKGCRWFLLDHMCQLVPWEVTWQGQHARPG